jgi:hypothetical protein
MYLLPFWTSEKPTIFLDRFFCLASYEYEVKYQGSYDQKKFFVEFKDCVLCDTCPEETIMHLFFECSFSMRFWWAIGIEWNTDMQLHNMIKDAKNIYSLDFFMEIIITRCWSLWDQRNSFIFNQIDPPFNRFIHKFKDYCSIILHRARPSLKEGMQAWLDTL